MDGKPRIVSQQYLGSSVEVMAKLAGSSAGEPVRTQHKSFGDVAAVWSVLERLDVIGVIDSVVGTRRSDAGASVGAYLALAALNRVVAPTSKLQFEPWWKTTAAERFTKIPAGVLDHRRFANWLHRMPAASSRAALSASRQVTRPSEVRMASVQRSTFTT